MIEFGEANHVTAAVAAIAVEEVLERIHQKAWFMIFVQRAQSHDSTPAECSGRPPILGLQIVQQRNLLFQLVESLTTHGLLASMGRIRQSAPRSQARMVGNCKKCWCCTPALSQHHTLMSRRCTHRRTVDGSGKCVGSLQCGAACSAVSPAAMCAQACCRQCKVKGADGASQPGKAVKVFRHGRQMPRRTQMRSCWSSRA